MRYWPILLLVPFCFGHVGGCGHDDVVGAEGVASFEAALDARGTRVTFVHIDVHGPDETVELALHVEGHPVTAGVAELGLAGILAGPSADGLLRQESLICTMPCAVEQRLVVRAGDSPTRWAFEARVRINCSACGDNPIDVRVNVHEHD